MTTSHKIFDVTVKYLLIVSPEAVLNNQVPIQFQNISTAKSFNTEASFKTDQVM